MQVLNLAGCSTIVACQGVTHYMNEEELKAVVDQVLTDARHYDGTLAPRLLLVAVPVGTLHTEKWLRQLGGRVLENVVSAHNQFGINLWLIPGKKGEPIYHGQHSGIVKRANAAQVPKSQQERISKLSAEVDGRIAAFDRAEQEFKSWEIQNGG